MKKQRTVESATSITSVTSKKIFAITGLAINLRGDLVADINKLGGIVLEGDVWNPDCTHVICSKPTKSEKCLAAIASGVWY